MKDLWKWKTSMWVQLYDGNRFVDIAGVTFLRLMGKKVCIEPNCSLCSPCQQSLTVVTGSNDTNVHTSLFTEDQHRQCEDLDFFFLFMWTGQFLMCENMMCVCVRGGGGTQLRDIKISKCVFAVCVCVCVCVSMAPGVSEFYPTVRENVSDFESFVPCRRSLGVVSLRVCVCVCVCVCLPSLSALVISHWLCREAPFFSQIVLKS